MYCFPKNIPPNLSTTSGNRGASFYYKECFLIEAALCAITIQERDDMFIALEEAIFDDDLILVECLND